MKTTTRYTLLAAGLIVAALSALAMAESAETPDLAGKLVKPYLHIQSALAADNLAAARAGADSLLSTLDSASETEILKGFRDDAESIKAAEEIAVAREAFLGLSNDLIVWLNSGDNVPEGNPLFIAHCPMAFDGKGADWIQSDKVINNPYYGARMLRCGAIKAQISQGNDKAHPDHHPEMKNLHHSHGSATPARNADPYSQENLDAVHAGVPGYSAQYKSPGTNKPAAGGCQMACCQSGS